MAAIDRDHSDRVALVVLEMVRTLRDGRCGDIAISNEIKSLGHIRELRGVVGRRDLQASALASFFSKISD